MRLVGMKKINIALTSCSWIVGYSVFIGKTALQLYCRVTNLLLAMGWILIRLPGIYHCTLSLTCCWSWDVM